MPERTCIGCGKKAEQGALLRLALSGGRLAVDRERRLAGRGAWLHADAGCLAKAEKKRAAGRAFRVKVGEVDWGPVRNVLTATGRKD